MRDKPPTWAGPLRRDGRPRPWRTPDLPFAKVAVRPIRSWAKGIRSRSGSGSSRPLSNPSGVRHDPLVHAAVGSLCGQPLHHPPERRPTGLPAVAAAPDSDSHGGAGGNECRSEHHPSAHRRGPGASLLDAENYGKAGGGRGWTNRPEQVRRDHCVRCTGRGARRPNSFTARCVDTAGLRRGRPSGNHLLHAPPNDPNGDGVAGGCGLQRQDDAAVHRLLLVPGGQGQAGRRCMRRPGN